MTHAVPLAARFALAMAAGARPGEWVTIRCSYCPTEGAVFWWLTRSGRPSRWVTFSDRFAIDHILAVALGGSDDIENLTISCRSCNASKKDLPLDEFLRRSGVAPESFTEVAMTESRQAPTGKGREGKRKGREELRLSLRRSQDQELRTARVPIGLGGR